MRGPRLWQDADTDADRAALIAAVFEMRKSEVILARLPADAAGAARQKAKPVGV